MGTYFEFFFYLYCVIKQWNTENTYFIAGWLFGASSSEKAITMKLLLLISSSNWCNEFSFETLSFPCLQDGCLHHHVAEVLVTYICAYSPSRKGPCRETRVYLLKCNRPFPLFMPLKIALVMWPFHKGFRTFLLLSVHMQISAP